jgi:hypothetical protein
MFPFLCASFRRPTGVLWSLTCPDDIREPARAPVPGVLAEAVAVGTDEALAGAVVITERQRTREIQLTSCLRRVRPLPNPRNHVVVRTGTRARAGIWIWLPPWRAHSPSQRARSYNTGRVSERGNTGGVSEPGDTGRVSEPGRPVRAQGRSAWPRPCRPDRACGRRSPDAARLWSGSGTAQRRSACCSSRPRAAAGPQPGGR